MKTQWNILQQSTDEKRKLADELGISLILAHLLLNRGLKNDAAGRAFLKSSLNDLHDPYLFRDMDKAAEIVKESVFSGEKILVFGDYDVDGITATALLYHFFKHIGADVSHHIPDRIEEGYSLNIDFIEEARKNGVNLLISVDCGITNLSEIARARELGMKVIVTDHHEPAEELPPADAILNPKVDGARYPFRNLAGVGVAFKLAWAVAQKFNNSTKVSEDMRGFLLSSLAFVALGTIADVVPLMGENRIFAHFGLKYLEETINPGLRALIDISNLAGAKLEARDIAYRMGPRLNASGRMGKSALGIELLVTPNTQRALEVAGLIDSENSKRQDVERKILEEAYELLRREVNLDKDGAVVLASENWHLGVIGIVASRLAEEFYRPVALISLEDGKGRGSARSVPDLPLHELLSECREHLEAFGGHALAAGLEMKAENFPPFKEKFLSRIAKRLDGKELLPILNLDMEVLFSALSKTLVMELERLQPFGEMNPPPLFATYGTRLVGRPRVVGRDANHLSFFVRQGDFTMKAIAFGKADVLPKLKESDSFNIAYRPFISNWRGEENVELEIRDFSFD